MNGLLPLLPYFETSFIGGDCQIIIVGKSVSFIKDNQQRLRLTEGERLQLLKILSSEHLGISDTGLSSISHPLSYRNELWVTDKGQLSIYDGNSEFIIAGSQFELVQRKYERELLALLTLQERGWGGDYGNFDKPHEQFALAAWPATERLTILDSNSISEHWCQLTLSPLSRRNCQLTLSQPIGRQHTTIKLDAVDSRAMLSALQSQMTLLNSRRATSPLLIHEDKNNRYRLQLLNLDEKHESIELVLQRTQDRPDMDVHVRVRLTRVRNMMGWLRSRCGQQ
jgi:hypothetical protein